MRRTEEGGTEFLCGEALCVDIQCRDRLKAPAPVTTDMRVRLQVVVSDWRRQESTVDLGVRTLHVSDVEDESWSLSIFFMPRDQPSVQYPLRYKLRVTPEADEDASSGAGVTVGSPAGGSADDSGDVAGDALKEAALSNEWTYSEERKVGSWSEIDAGELGKYHEDSRLRTLPERREMITQGAEAQIWRNDSHDVVRHLRDEWWKTSGTRSTYTDCMREFFKDVCLWKRVSDRCAGRVAQCLGWYLELDQVQVPRGAGFLLKAYERSLDKDLVVGTAMIARYELALGVLNVMADLHQNFQEVVFPDIKPLNFLVASSTSGGRAAPRTVVLTDLSNVRGLGQPVKTYTRPYAPRECQTDAPSRHEFERHATLMTLLQILLGKQSGNEVEHWGQPGPMGTPILEVINQLRVDPELKEQTHTQNGLVADLINFFRPLNGPLERLPSYETMRDSLECACPPAP